MWLSSMFTVCIVLLFVPLFFYRYVYAGIPSLASYMDATRIQFNPTSYEIFQQRLTTIGQFVRPSDVDFLPVMMQK